MIFNFYDYVIINETKPLIVFSFRPPKTFKNKPSKSRLGGPPLAAVNILQERPIRPLVAVLQSGATATGMAMPVVCMGFFAC